MLKGLVEIMKKLLKLMFDVTLDTRIDYKVRREYGNKISEIQKDMEELLNGSR